MHPDLKPGLRQQFQYTVPSDKTVPRERVVIDHARFMQKVAPKAAKA